MHIQTHILSGWCIANQFNFSPRERALCMIAAAIADLDGSGIFFGQKYYWEYHHKLGHNLFFGLLSSLLLAFLLLFLWTLWIARQQGRTPIETITPRLDREMIAALRRFTRYNPA